MKSNLFFTLLFDSNSYKKKIFPKFFDAAGIHYIHNIQSYNIAKWEGIVVYNNIYIYNFKQV